MARRLGWLGPILVIVGAAIAGLGAWYVVRARPQAGPLIDEIAIDGGTLVLRAEAGGRGRSFIELHAGGELKWQALVPRYIGERGRPGVAWSAHTVTVRVERNGRAEVFAFARSNAAKIGGFRLAPEREPIVPHREGPITITDHERSYEFVGGSDWHQLIAIDLRTGLGVWKLDLGKPAIAAAGVEGTTVWVDQSGILRRIDALTGREGSEPSAN